jgi:hypothetical protein
MRWLVAMVGSGALLVACGGVVEGGSKDPNEDPAKSPAPDQDDDDAASPAFGEPGTDLGECVLGPAETYGIPCAWVAKERCYEKRAMACNCACPRTHDSQCTSGFESGPEGHVWVVCD